VTLTRFFALILLGAVAACFGAGPQLADQQARTSLDLYADLIDPVYEVAMQSCIDRQDQLARDLDEHTLAELKQIEADIAIVSARCHRLRDAFDLLRTLHARAGGYLEAGKADEALELVEQIRQTWRELRRKAEQ
jgi:hypothetical protein